MKPFLPVLLLFAVLCNCCKEPTPMVPGPSRNHWGIAHASQNNIPWKAYPICREIDTVSHKLSIQLDSFTHWTEILAFHEVPAAAGIYELVAPGDTSSEKVSAHFSYWNYDYEAAGYYPLEGANNRLVLESFDPLSREVKGSFALTLVVHDRRYYPQAVDTIRFTDGRFHGRLYE